MQKYWTQDFLKKTILSIIANNVKLEVSIVNIYNILCVEREIKKCLAIYKIIWQIQENVMCKSFRQFSREFMSNKNNKNDRWLCVVTQQRYLQWCNQSSYQFTFQNLLHTYIWPPKSSCYVWYLSTFQKGTKICIR